MIKTARWRAILLAGLLVLGIVLLAPVQQTAQLQPLANISRPLAQYLGRGMEANIAPVPEMITHNVSVAPQRLPLGQSGPWVIAWVSDWVCLADFAAGAFVLLAAALLRGCRPVCAALECVGHIHAQYGPKDLPAR